MILNEPLPFVTVPLAEFFTPTVTPGRASPLVLSVTFPLIFIPCAKVYAENRHKQVKKINVLTKILVGNFSFLITFVIKLIDLFIGFDGRIAGLC
jgi:hypothetical protein